MIKKRLFINGQILTMDTTDSLASAFAISGDRYLMVGSDVQARSCADAGSEITDLQGKTVVPGLIESHSHLSLYAMTLLQANCRTPPNKSLEDVRVRIRQMAAELGPGQWIKGWGYDDTLIAEKRHLTRSDLDEAAPRNPVFISHASGHLGYANSQALELAGINPDTPQPQGGEIDMDAQCVLSGLLKEEAQGLVIDHIPVYEVARLKEGMHQAVLDFHKFGITSIHDAAIGYFKHERPIIQAYRQLESEGRLDIRVYLTIVERAYRPLLNLGLGTGFGSDFLRLGAVKLFQDGSIQAITAALKEPYLNNPGKLGNLICSQEDLDALLEKYQAANVQVAVHANGDQAIDSVLHSIERAQRRHPKKVLRHMIIHCQLASLDQIRKMKLLGVIPSYFVNHVFYWGDRHLNLFLGPGRAKNIDPLGTTVGENLIFTLHSDLPVTPVDPLFSIHCAVNRLTRDGEILGAEQRISPLEALKAYTKYAAYCSYEENSKGSIEIGKLADFTVLSDNPLTVPKDKIKDIRVMSTFVGGRCVFQRDY